MKPLTSPRFLLLAALWIPAPLFSAPDTEEPLTPMDWELPAEYIKENGFRGETILNARWLGRETGKTEQSIVRVPDNTYSGKRENFEHSREFSLPQVWQGRQIFLETGGISSAATVFINGHELLSIPAGSRFHQVELKPELLKPIDNVLMIRGGFIRDDVKLLSYPKSTIAVDDSYIQTSVRTGTVKIDVAGRAPAGSSVQPVVKIFSDDKAQNVVKTVTSPSPVIVDSKGTWSVTLSAPWADAKLWSQWEPNLYFYVTEVSDSSGKVADRQLPRSFGFREVWAEGKTFYLNGKPLHFYGDTWTGSVIRNGNAYIEQAEKFVDNVKLAGITAAHRIESDHGLDLMDRKGMIVPYCYVFGLDIPVEANVLAEGEAGDEGGDQEIRGAADLKLDQSKDRIVRYIKRWREHPSIMTWSTRGPWSRVTLDSTQQGNVENPWEFWPGNKDDEAVAKNKRRYEIAELSRAFVQAQDPTRVVSLQNQPRTQVEWATRYVCENLDIQERAEFFKRYHEAPEPRRILWPSEYDASPFPGHSFLRKAALQMPQGKAYPAIHLENGARYLGEKVYLQEPEERLKKWNRMQDEAHRSSPVYQDLIAQNFYEILPGWRAAGISGMAHWVMREGFEASKTRKKIEDRLNVPRKVDARRPGFSVAVGSPDQPGSFPLFGIDEQLAAGTQLMRGVSPLLAYIGGAAGNPWNRDHLFWSGQLVTKSLVLLSDYAEPIAVSGNWQVTDSQGKVVASNVVHFEVPAGGRVLSNIPIQFKAPEVAKRTDFAISFKLQASKKGHLEDQFALTVFPKTPDAKKNTSANVWVFPGPGAQVATQIATSVAQKVQMFTNPTQTIRAGDLIIVPRMALHPSPDGKESPASALLTSIKIDDLISNGARLLVLEQSLPNLFGMEMEDVRPRRTFMAAEGHPALAGLQNSDLSYWTGQSDLDPEFTQNTPDQRVFPKRIWKVGNQNVVATRTLVRPQTGASRALVVSGFDLAESPLLEVTRGGGRILFCQMDVSNRFGIDPAATLLAKNVVSYLMQVPNADPSRGEVALVKEGEKIAWRPKTYRAAKPEGQDAWGITNAELFFRESIYEEDWITPKAPEGDVAVFSGTETAEFPQVIRRGPKAFEMSLDEAQFKTGWAKKKVAYLRSTLVVNQGGSRSDGPAWNLQGNTKALYPHVWVKGFVHPYTAACW